jgi:hypothetical protein
MAAWPDSLPTSWGGDARRTPDNTLLRTAVDVGPAKQRPRAAVRVMENAVWIALAVAQKATLETFFYTTLNGGGDAFDWSDFSVSPSVAASFRFRAPPRYEYRAGDLWQAHLDLEQLP